MPPAAQSATSSRTRDPERRRREILTAAAEVITTSGPAALTHRAVAAQAGMALGTLTRHFPSIDELRRATLAMLTDQIDTELGDFASRLETLTPAQVPDAVTDLIHSSLCDPREVATTAALVAAATSSPELRDLSVRWTERFVQVLAPYTGAPAARAVEVFFDGALTHAALHPSPLSRTQVRDAVGALLALPTR